MTPSNTNRQNPASRPPGLQRFTLRQLEAFCAIAQMGSISAASGRLSRTQSAVSMALQDLESALGVALFLRRNRRLIRTEAAQVLLPRAIEMVDRAREIGEIVSQNTDAASHIAVGASRTIGPYVVPELIAQSRQTVRKIQVSLTVANSEDLIRMIRSFDLDCAFVEGDVLDPSLDKQPWLDDQLCLFARAEHPVFTSSSRLDKRLASYEWVLREPGSGTREIFLRAIAPIISSPAISVELNDPESQKRVVMRSDLLSCISRRAISDELASGSLREMTGVSSALKRSLLRRFWIVRHPERFQTQALQSLLEIAEHMHQSGHQAENSVSKY